MARQYREDVQDWYVQLAKPWFAPPAWVFGPVWTVLYFGIAVSFGYVFWQVVARRWPGRIALPFVLNLIFNVAFTPIQFGLRNLPLALADVMLVLATIVWMMIAVWPYSRGVALAQLPYLGWVAFATVLQASLTWLNR